MIKQTSIHLKLDSGLLVRLDNICKSAGVNRNKAINKALASILVFCEYQLKYDKSVHFFD